MVFLTGPRQVGKTHLAKDLMGAFRKTIYLNHDVPEDRRVILRGLWNPGADLVVFDEIHKMRDWKTFLKGIVDARPKGQALLVAGSARMETIRQSGESLAGRYFHHRVQRSLLREPKLYFYDTGLVRGDEGVKLENAVAVCLLKMVHHLRDNSGCDVSLHYLKTCEGREVDFALVHDNRLETMMEVKVTAREPSRQLHWFSSRFPETSALLLPEHQTRELREGGIGILPASDYLALLPI